ncbi:hypothetical protein [Flagellimonas meishanensis]|uniref:hypothetical protein n=1 Tax=Flagellimonas meishanensis TaxID=2873264 RepID=UPI001CA6400C|nr:hypothetical protein [[Muricauda] meishanensis]
MCRIFGLKSYVVRVSLLCFCNLCFSQQQTFENRLHLDPIEKYGSLLGNENQGWPFEMKSKSCLSGGLWEHILPKSVVDGDQMVITRKELEYLLEMDGNKILSESPSISNPPHWENRFGKQIQTITFDKPLHALTIRKNRLERITLKSLQGMRYATYYPYGELDIIDHISVPIVYKQENILESNTLILLVTSHFLDQIDLEKVKINSNKMVHGNEEYSETMLTLGVDFNNDGQHEVLMYQNRIEDAFAMEEDGVSHQPNSIIGLYFENCWYRTSFWQEGQDGLEGF